MRLTISVDGAKIQWLKRSLQLISRMGLRISTASFDMLGEERWATSGFAIARVNAIGGYTFPYSKDEVKIDRALTPMNNCAVGRFVAMGGEGHWLDHFFGGYIATIDHRLIGRRRIYRITAQDYNVLPATSTTQGELVTESYVDNTEQEIIDHLFANYLPEIDTSTSYVESSGDTFTLDWTRLHLDKALDELATINEKEWYIDHDKKLHYFTPVTTAAPFKLSSSPWGTVDIGYDGLQHVEDNSAIINKVTVVYDGGTVIRTDATSYAYYGRYYEAKIVDKNIDTAAWANLRGNAILAESAWGKIRGRLTCHQEGLIVGQKVSIYNFLRGINAYYLIQGIRLGMVNVFTEKVDIEYGDYSPTLVDLLLKINKLEEKEE